MVKQTREREATDRVRRAAPTLLVVGTFGRPRHRGMCFASGVRTPHIILVLNKSLHQRRSCSSSSRRYMTSLSASESAGACTDERSRKKAAAT